MIGLHGDPRRFKLGKTRRDVDATLRLLVRDAYEHVAAFRERMDAARVSPAVIRGVADLERLPVCDRQAFASVHRVEYLRAGTDPARCRLAQTGGTTGAPLDIFMSAGESLYRRVLLFQAIRRNVRLPVPFTIAEIGAGELRVRRRGPGQNLVVARVVRIPRLLPITEQMERTMDAHPDVITGPPSCIEILADALAERGSRVSPRLVAPRGEMLRPATRDRLRSVFGCKVADYYNCNEVGNVAWECPGDASILHVNSDACTVEVVGDKGPCPPGVSGRVVLTNLYNWTMPFIRYEIGDRAALLPESGRACRCGHRGPSLFQLEGREGDYLWTSDGRRISPRTVASLFAAACLRGDGGRYAPRRFQVVQEEDGRFHVRVVPERGPEAGLSERISDLLRTLDPKIRIVIDFVEEIPPEPSGKFRAIYSKWRPPTAINRD